MRRTDARLGERYASIIFLNKKGGRPLRFPEKVVKGAGPSVTG